MENIVSLIVPAVLVLLFIRLIFSQLRLIWKIGLNSLAGFLSLWLLNLISGFTGLVFPINFVTALISGFLGIPGIILLALGQLFL